MFQNKNIYNKWILAFVLPPILHQVLRNIVVQILVESKSDTGNFVTRLKKIRAQEIFQRWCQGIS